MFVAPLKIIKAKTEQCLSLSKDKVRVAEGTAVIPDLREPSKLGVSFSYCKYCSSSGHLSDV